MHSQSVVVCAAGVVGTSGKVVVGLLVDGVGNSKVGADNSSSGLRGGMGSCRHMSVGRHGSNRSSINMFIDSSSRSDMFIDSCSSSINRINSNTFGNSSSYYSGTVPLIMHRPNGGSEGHLIVVLTLLGGTRRNRHPRPTLRWAACISASGAEDSGIWPRSVPLHSGSKVHATAVVSMATATTTASPTRTTTTHTHTPTLLAIQVASTGGAAELCHGHIRTPNSSSLSSNPSATTVMADGPGGASTAVLVYLQRVATGVTVVYNNGTSVVTTQVMALVVATAAVATATTVIVGTGGVDDGYTLVAGDSDPPPNWVMAEQQDGRNYAEDDSGPLAGTFGTSQDFSAEDSIVFPTLGPGLHVLAHPSRHRHALLALSKRRIDGAQWWVGDSGASVHGTGSMDHFYNTRSPTPEESRLIVGTGEVMQVKCIGDLDMVLHCDEDVVVTLREVSFVPGLWYELMSFNIIQETEDIVLNKTGAHMLRGRVHFDKEKNGNYVQATRVARGSRGPPAMVAAVMRPGRQRSMNINDMHYCLGHANDATLRETAKQLRLKLTGHR